MVRKKNYINIYFVIDRVIPNSSTTKEIFNALFKSDINDILNGINMTIFAYGQTSTGKTFTMQGSIPDNEGIIPLTLKEIFYKINNDIEILNSKITVSFIEIYNESINDLLDNSKINLDLRETSNKEIIINNLTEIKINNHEEAQNLLIKGNESRIVASTKLNEKSSRSHSIFRLNVEVTKNKSKNTEFPGTDSSDKIILKSHINLIDLAGSENSSKTGCVGQRLKEGSNINKSLLALSNVINKLSQNNGNNVFVNYRDSKLTRLLQNSLGGNSKTTIICTITDDIEHYNETMNTLHFGNKAKNIKTIVKVNEIKNQNCQQMLIENERLKKKLRELEKELTTQKKYNINEMILMTENHNINKGLYNKDITFNLTAPPKVNLNNTFLLCNTNSNTNNNYNNTNSNNNKNNNSFSINNNDEFFLSKYSNKTNSIIFNRTQLAINNMEKELTLLKKYLLTEQKENYNSANNNNLERCSLFSSDIRRNLMLSNAKNNNLNFKDNEGVSKNTVRNFFFSENCLNISNNKKNNNTNNIILCNVENFVLNKKNKNNKIKELEDENNRLKYELSLIKNKNINTDKIIDLDEGSMNNKVIDDKKKKSVYFFNKGRKILLSKISKIKFIKNFSNKIKNINKGISKNDNEDTQILIQMNQTIKNLNQNIISDNNTDKRNNFKFLQKKKSNKNN